MTAMPKVIEGTWEEIARHATELTGRRFRLTAIDEPSLQNHPAFDTSPEATAAWVERFKARIASLPVIRLGDDSRDAIYEDCGE